MMVNFQKKSRSSRWPKEKKIALMIIMFLLKGCSSIPNDFPTKEPLLIRLDVKYTDVLEYENAFILPSNKTGSLEFDVDKTFIMACPGGKLSVSGKEINNATCFGSGLTIDGKSYSAEVLECTNYAVNVAVEDKATCMGNGTGINLGFQVNGVMYPLIYTCFDKQKLMTYYSLERLPAEVKDRATGGNRPDFVQDSFYPNLNVDSLYKVDNQRAAFEKLLGSSSLADKYMDKDSLNRGHLSPNADFIMGSHSRVTFHFVNAAPQWSLFNSGVWENLEASLRNYAGNKLKDLIIYTGNLGVLSYPDINGVPTPIYLYQPKTANQTLPVPKFFWKIVLEPISKRGVAFVGINDPFHDKPTPADYIICSDITSDISWLQVTDRYSLLYACDVQDFVTSLPSFPKVDTSGGVLKD